MLFLLPNLRGVEIPGTIMKHLAPQLDPNATILFGPEATAENAREAIEKLNPAYVFTTGHGIPCATTLQNNQPFVTLAEPQMNPQYCSENRNLDIWKGRVVHLHSCWCGRLLAPVLVQKYGAWAVFAHDDEFLFILPDDGKTITKDVAAPFLAEFTVDKVMLSGGTTGEAQEERMNAYDKWIDYYLHGEGKESDKAAILVRILTADKMISKLYGDTTATVTRPRHVEAKLTLPLEAERGSSVSMALVFIPLAILALGGGHGTEGHNGLD